MNREVKGPTKIEILWKPIGGLNRMFLYMCKQWIPAKVSYKVNLIYHKVGSVTLHVNVLSFLFKIT